MQRQSKSSVQIYLPQSDGGRQCGVVELGALWLWVKTLWWLLGATEPAVRSDWSPIGSGSCTRHVFVVGLETGVPWTGGDGHGEPRGDTLEGGKPEKEEKNLTICTYFYFPQLNHTLTGHFIRYTCSTAC